MYDQLFRIILNKINPLLIKNLKNSESMIKKKLENF